MQHQRFRQGLIMECKMQVFLLMSFMGLVVLVRNFYEEHFQQLLQYVNIQYVEIYNVVA